MTATVRIFLVASGRVEDVTGKKVIRISSGIKIFASPYFMVIFLLNSI